MSLSPQFAELTTNTVFHRAYTGISGYGAISYASSSAGSTYPAYIEEKRRLIVTSDGREEMAAGRLFIPSTSASVSQQDWLALNASTEPLRILNVDPRSDLDGQHHLEIDFG